MMGKERERWGKMVWTGERGGAKASLCVTEESCDVVREDVVM